MGVNLGFTGVGGRGRNLLETCLRVDGADVVAVCDATDRNRETATEVVVEAGEPPGTSTPITASWWPATIWMGS